MADIFCDINIVTVQWFLDAFEEMREESHVRILFPKCQKYKEELARVSKFAALMKVLEDKGKCISLSQSACEKEMEQIEKNPIWRDCEQCDDPQVFATSALHPNFYLFTMERRLNECKDRLVKHLDKKYTRFKTIKSEKTYRDHKQEIFR